MGCINITRSTGKFAAHFHYIRAFFKQILSINLPVGRYIIDLVSLVKRFYVKSVSFFACICNYRLLVYE